MIFITSRQSKVYIQLIFRSVFEACFQALCFSCNVYATWSNIDLYFSFLDQVLDHFLFINTPRHSNWILLNLSSRVHYLFQSINSLSSSQLLFDSLHVIFLPRSLFILYQLQTQIFFPTRVKFSGVRTWSLKTPDPPKNEFSMIRDCVDDQTRFPKEVLLCLFYSFRHAILVYRPVSIPFSLSSLFLHL